jgi:hypothetical protein
VPTPNHPYFRVNFAGWQGEIPASELLWLQQPDPVQPYGRGHGVAQSLSDELETDEYAAAHVKQWFYNRARPDMIITMEGAKPDERQRAELHWQQRHQGFWRAFRPFFTSHKMQVDVISQTFESMQFIQLRQYERDTVIQVLGIPPEVLGIIENSNRATIDSAGYLFDLYCVVPRLEFLREIFQERLVPEFDDRLIIDYDSPVQDDKQFQLQAAQAAPWALTLDEWRALAGQLPKEDGSGGLHLVPTSLMPRAEIQDGVGAPPSFPMALAASGGAVHKENAGGIAGELRPVVKEPDGDEEVEIDLHRIADRYRGPLRRAFLAAVARMQADIAPERLRAALASGQVEAALRAIPLEGFGGLESAVRDVLGTVLSNAGTQAARALADTIGIDVTFHVVNPRAVRLIAEEATTLVQGLTESSRQALRDLLTEVFTGDLSLDDAAQRIADTVGLTPTQMRSLETFRTVLAGQGVAPEAIIRRASKLADALKRQRGDTIARTETISTASAAQHEAWRQAVDAGLINPREARRLWRVTHDDRLDTHVCEPMDGQERPLQEPFITGDGRRVMHPAAHPRCRCVVSLIVRQTSDREEDPNAIE